MRVPVLEPGPSTVTVEPYAGTSMGGAVQYGASFSMQCLKSEGRRLVRDDRGNQVVSETTLYCDLGVEIPVQSRVTLPDGRKAPVLSSKACEAPGLPLPEYTEVVLR